MARTKHLHLRSEVLRRLPSHASLQHACEVNDILRVREIFAAESLGSDYAARCSLDVESVDLMRCLLEHGADIETYMHKKSPKSLDIIRLFVEFGYDVKADGHKILQQVAQTNRCEKLADVILGTLRMIKKHLTGYSTTAPTSIARMMSGRIVIIVADSMAIMTTR